jgi:prepilin-type N-terminal cleavage/methylation domain-containing protein
MMNGNTIQGNKGFSLIELLVVLVISAVAMAAVFQSFVAQVHPHAAQEQVVEMRQNLRASVDRMTREIRMAGYGGNMMGAFGNVNTFTSVISPVNGSSNDSVTIILADEMAKLSQNAPAGTTQLILNVTNGSDLFNTNKKKYVCLNGQNNYVVANVSGDTITLATPLSEDHLANETVSLVKAITYKIQSGTANLVRDENTGGGNQIMTDAVEDLQFQYILSDGSVSDSPGTPSEIRSVSLTVAARTQNPHPTSPGDGYQRQTLTSHTEVRNLGL